MPARFLADAKGDVAKARAKWEACKAWRKAHDVDGILQRPHPKWDVIKRCYPQALHGRGLKGELISIEVPGTRTDRQTNRHTNRGADPLTDRQDPEAGRLALISV